MDVDVGFLSGRMTALKGSLVMIRCPRMISAAIAITSSIFGLSSRRLAIQNDDFARRTRLEKETIRVIPQRGAIKQITQPARHSEHTEIEMVAY